MNDDAEAAGEHLDADDEPNEPKVKFLILANRPPPPPPPLLLLVPLLVPLLDALGSADSVVVSAGATLDVVGAVLVLAGFGAVVVFGADVGASRGIAKLSVGF